jgi:hypothetical protein
MLVLITQVSVELRHLQGHLVTMHRISNGKI